MFPKFLCCFPLLYFSCYSHSYINKNMNNIPHLLLQFHWKIKSFEAAAVVLTRRCRWLTNKSVNADVIFLFRLVTKRTIWLTISVIHFFSLCWLSESTRDLWRRFHPGDPRCCGTWTPLRPTRALRSLRRCTWFRRSEPPIPSRCKRRALRWRSPAHSTSSRLFVEPKKIEWKSPINHHTNHCSLLPALNVKE